MPKLDEYLQITEAAEFIGVSPNTLRNWEAAGKIGVRRNPINGYRLFKITELEALMVKIEKSNRPIGHTPAKKKKPK